MSKNLFELKADREAALNRAETVLKAAETRGRQMTSSETAEYDEHIAEADSLGRRVKEREAKSTLRHMMKDGMLIPGSSAAAKTSTVAQRKFLSSEYNEAFFGYIASSGTRMESALYEGSDGSGGYAVPITVDSNIVPLAPPDHGVRTVASIVPTAMDIKIPRKGSFGVAAAKAESGTTDNSFPETDPTLEQFTLSAFMAGIRETVSWELAQDVPSFQAFCVQDMLQAQQIYEGAKYLSGSGNGEPQGLLGNVGAGVTSAVADSLGNLLSIDATFDVLGLLKTPYHQNASWLMQRSTAVALRKAQKQANLFEPVFTRVGNQDFLHGYPVVYDSNMPVIAAGATPVLFGDFKQGYVIGDRGGSGINVKVLDQVKAIQGQLVLLAYRRSDGRVRRSEAIQAITLHS
ncbi:phage major capsid protein [Edaphobacter sp. HDX4]|uniref:phage major capsid protein n=1 Tax=Edaphobacter sp. HDX4 TaxID=2794064 RepID=UPI002FE5CF85